MQELRGHISGLAIPHLVIDTPGGMGKVSIGPDYVVARGPDKWTLRNYEGKLVDYPQPADKDADLRLRRGVFRSLTARDGRLNLRGRPTGRTGPACSSAQFGLRAKQTRRPCQMSWWPSADPAVLGQHLHQVLLDPLGLGRAGEAEPHRQPLDVRVDDDPLGDPERGPQHDVGGLARDARQRGQLGDASWGSPRRSGSGSPPPSPSGSWPSAGRSRSSG